MRFFYYIYGIYPTLDGITDARILNYLNGEKQVLLFAFSSKQ